MSDLSLVSTEDLKLELKKRSDAGVVMSAMNRSQESGELDFSFWGDVFTVIGLLRAAANLCERDASELMREEDDEDE